MVVILLNDDGGDDDEGGDDDDGGHDDDGGRMQQCWQ